MLSSLEWRGVFPLCPFHRAHASDFPVPQSVIGKTSLETERMRTLVELALV